MHTENFENKLRIFKFKTEFDFYSWLNESGYQFDFRLKQDSYSQDNYYVFVSTRDTSICCVISQAASDNSIKLTTIYNTGSCKGYIRSDYIELIRKFLTNYLNCDIRTLSDSELEKIGFVENNLDNRLVDIFNIQHELHVTFFYIDWLNNPRVNTSNIRSIAYLTGHSGDEDKLDKLMTFFNYCQINEMKLIGLNLTNFWGFGLTSSFALTKLSFEKSKIGKTLSLATLKKLEFVDFAEADLTNLKPDGLTIPASLRELDLYHAKLGNFRLSIERKGIMGAQFVFKPRYFNSPWNTEY